MERKEQADHILYQCGLLKELEVYGSPHIIGSYRMDVMAWNDLDIDVGNDGMSLEKLYRLSDYIAKAFRPTWYEAKEERDAEGKTVWFHGFEAPIRGQLWNIDIWFLDGEAIDKAERYCDSIARRVSGEPALKQSILNIKRELLARKLYAPERYTSMDVYDAVLNCQISSIDDFLERYAKRHA